MSTAKQIALDFLARMNAGDLAGAAAVMAEDSIHHAALPEAQGRAGFQRIAGKLRAAFPDLHHAIEDVLVDGDKVVLRVTLTGTHTGALDMIRLALPATGKQVRYEQIHILRVAAGHIVESWMALDIMAMLRQLGLKVVAA
ncbi:MAG: ester cyclase [Acidobacteriota bacterium]